MISGTAGGARAIAALLPPTASSVACRGPAARRSPAGRRACARRRLMKSASGSGSLPALCAQSTSSRPPAAATRAAISAIGWITPVSLLTDWTATSGRSAPASAESRSARSSVPSRRRRDPARLGRAAQHGRMLDRRDDARPGLRAAHDDLDRLGRARGEDQRSPPSPAPPRSAAARPPSRRARRGPRHGPRRDWPSSRRRPGSPRPPAGRIGVVAA